MIVKPRDAEAFMAGPPASLVAVLFYGPDAGLVSERAKALVAKKSGDSEDPFAVVELTKRDLDSDPRRLADELAAIPLTGGSPVVRLRDAGDDLSETISGSLELGGGFLVVEAGDLPPRSSLRKVFEGSELAAALPCYLDDQRDLAGLITAMLSEHGLSIGRAALGELTRSMGSDRLVTRREMEKLIDYVQGGDRSGEGSKVEVSVEDIRASVGDSSEVTLDDLAFSVAAGDPLRFERAYERAQAEGTAGVRVVRAVVRHFQRLHQVAAVVADGQPLDKGMAGLRPGVFWKQKESFGAQVRAWGVGRLERALVELLRCEVDAKSGGAPQDLLVQRALLRLTAQAPMRPGR